jgi:unsaturated rhamnogalacturonyl hydrolase
MYMGIPALAELGRMTGEQAYYDDAVRNVLQMSAYLFNPQLGIYTHGWNANNPDAPQFYWARANGWAVLSMSDLLDVLPKDHPGYPKVLEQLRKSLRGIAQLQSGSGLWHQMIDRNDSYLETSASAIFVYVLAHAVNEGWIRWKAPASAPPSPATRSITTTGPPARPPCTATARPCWPGPR